MHNDNYDYSKEAQQFLNNEVTSQSNSNVEGSSVNNPKDSDIYKSHDQLKSNDIDYEQDYQDYLDTFELNPPLFEGPPLNFEDFKTINYSTYEAFAHDVHSKLGFIPVGGIPMAAAKLAAAYGVKAATMQYQSIATKAARGDIPGAVNEFNSVLNETGKIVNAVKSLGTDTSGSSGPPGRSYGQGSLGGYNTGILNLNPKPLEITLNTGITNNAYGQYFIDATSNYAPLHITQARISPNAIYSFSKIRGFFDNVLVVAFQLASQANISFNVNSSNTFSIGNLMTYIDVISQTLQIYYFYTSLITYEQTGNARNEGMLKLRNMVTSADVDLLYQMGRLLKQYPIPPNLRKLIWYLSQTFSQTSLPGSPLLKMMPTNFATSTDVNGQFSAMFSTNISNAFNSMQDANFRIVGSMLARIAPSWLDPELNVPTGVPVHDPEFTTFFMNLPGFCSGSAGSNSKVPTVPNSQTDITYGSLANDLDGALYGLQTFYDTSLSAFTPNMLDVSIRSGYNTTRATNRISYYVGGSGSGFYPVVNDTNICYSRGETYVITDGPSTPFVTNGAELVKGVNVNSVSEVTYKLFEWCLDIESLKSSSNKQARSTTPSGRSSNKPKGKSNKSKSKSDDKEDEMS